MLFDDPYWVGVLELKRDGRLFAAKYIFGAEPSDQVVYEFVQRDLLALQARMTVGAPTEQRAAGRHINPKRAQREIRPQMASYDVSTRSQEARRLQIEANMQARHAITREETQIRRDHKREVAHARAKARHRGP